METTRICFTVLAREEEKNSVGALLCINCPRVEFDNNCKYRRPTCRIKGNAYCYSRLIIRVGALQCHYCRNIKGDNTCMHKESTCNIGILNYCFTEITAKGFSIKHVRQGCSRYCHRRRVGANSYEKAMLCCSRNLCNDHKDTGGRWRTQAQGSTWQDTGGALLNRAMMEGSHTAHNRQEALMDMMQQHNLATEKLVGSLKCKSCRNVRPGNVCNHVEGTCQAGKRRFCYSRMKVRGGRITHVDRGCTNVCISRKYKNLRRYAVYMVCCDQDYCNDYKFWEEKDV
ncbi:hypothetical protein JRQ81_010873 [Phrynocephalus forsythii]|uniref:Snake toxin/toxin-like domain-containing protein n=1 Tax=Phrynocephalus forsythii TaxID=171643 RepID=A0A9Q0X962_9SAUR|nr:hypothetical protein JRQ81_010873 [Phrynocephalus forsythii]